MLMIYNIDLKIFNSLNHITNISIFPYLFLFLSKIFNISNFVYYYFILILIFFIKLRKQDKEKHKDFFLVNYQKLIEIGSSFALIGLTYGLMKFSINAKRPFCLLDSKNYISIGNLETERCLSGFPSSHISLAFFIAYYLWGYTKNNFQKFCLISLVVLVGISRISLAMHFPWQLIISLFLVYIIILIAQILCRLFKTFLIMPIGKSLYKLCFN
jgi:membrane-associated phospholipid phosphatase